MYVGDNPVEQFAVPLPDDFDQANYPVLSAKLHAPDGSTLGGTLDAAYSTQLEEVLVDPPAVPFATAGIHSVRVTASTEDSRRLRLPAFRFVVEDESLAWHTLDSARDEWPTDGAYTDVQLYRLLEAARVECVAYIDDADLTAPGQPVPLEWLDAQLMQARNIANAAKADPGTSPDGSLFVIRPYPLDKFVRDLLRPQRRVPVIG